MFVRNFNSLVFRDLVHSRIGETSEVRLIKTLHSANQVWVAGKSDRVRQEMKEREQDGVHDDSKLDTVQWIFWQMGLPEQE